jgi:O-acetyl-ADP-ribose deacetylase
LEVGVPVVGAIKGNAVSVRLGNLTNIQADAYVVPQFRNEASYGGVGGAVARAGGERGLAFYDERMLQQGALRWGDAIITPSGGGNARFHLHVASVESGPEYEFAVVSCAFYQALKLAAENGITSIAAPALGTGTIGYLTPEQSAKAMMAALDKHATEGNPPLDVAFVIFEDVAACDAFARVLHDGLYQDAPPELGAKGIDHVAWRDAQLRDRTANRLAGVQGDGGIILDDDGGVVL